MGLPVANVFSEAKSAPDNERKQSGNDGPFDGIWSPHSK